ncbi:hypothetical protein HNR67_007788 [Crossiella cryophila]|uniref:Uncharacterized protein n=1 Tax=Crossiella cryophila TaxID=43355 RepID=A0A7W7CI56_9PSEU|nr:hypothetical protein [Crossiella cryophila]
MAKEFAPERAFEVLFARASRMYPCVSRARLVVDL